MSIATAPTHVAGDAHVACVYADDVAICRAVREYLAPVVAGEATGIVIATEAHWSAIAAALARDGADVDAMLRDERLFVREAPAVLAGFRHDGRIDAEGFDASVGDLVRRAVRRGLPVRAYGEMVMLLWDEGDVPGALELEGLWNALRTTEPFGLLCGYRHDAISEAGHADGFAGVCEAHAEVYRDFPLHSQSPREVRRFVDQSVAGWHHAGALLHDARVVASELATNAVMHAASAFRVAIRRSSSALRVAVTDASPVAPRLRDGSDGSGNGIRMLTKVAADWGVELTSDGKTVWAELRP